MRSLRRALFRTGVKRLLLLVVWLIAPVCAWAQDLANGVFLVAQPALTEATFRRTVILITQPPQAGTIGVIINRSTEIPLREVLPDHEHLAQQPHNLHFGGPVERQGLMFLVRADTPPPRSIPVLRDVYLTGDADWVNNALATATTLSAVRVYAGYSGWAPGQLRSEIEREGWYILPADSETIFDKNPAGVWLELVKRALLRPAAALNSN